MRSVCIVGLGLGFWLLSVAVTLHGAYPALILHEFEAYDFEAEAEVAHTHKLSLWNVNP